MVDIKAMKTTARLSFATLAPVVPFTLSPDGETVRLAPLGELIPFHAAEAAAVETAEMSEGASGAGLAEVVPFEDFQSVA